MFFDVKGRIWAAGEILKRGNTSFFLFGCLGFCALAYYFNRGKLCLRNISIYIVGSKIYIF